MDSGRSSTGWILLGVLALGCGGSVGNDGKGGSGPVAEGGAHGGSAGDQNAGGTAVGGSSGGGGLTANAGSGASGMGTLDGGGTAGASAGVDGYGGECEAIQQEAQQAADTSCSQDSDCEHPPHMAGDCLTCGAVMNVSSEQSSLEAVRSVCQRFYDEGCRYPIHSCIAMRLACIEGVCRQ